MADLRKLEKFGDVAAEDDAVLDYFLSTERVAQIGNGEKYVVLGRKGSGKTAIVRHFTEAQGAKDKSLTLRSYPWKVHAEWADAGASDVEAFVASWRYVIAVELAAEAIRASGSCYLDEQRALNDFLSENYGGVQPEIGAILRSPRLRLKGISLLPSIAGNSLGGLELARDRSNLNLGAELNAVSGALIRAAIKVLQSVNRVNFKLHFDELDQGLTTLDDDRAALIVGLLIAAAATNRDLGSAGCSARVVVYLRTDIWDDLRFSDKNKMEQTRAISLEWTAESLLEMVNFRLKARMGADVVWADVIDDQLMRGTQEKFSHIVARTFRRPRDVIKFLNSALDVAKARNADPLVFVNQDIVSARQEFSDYFKKELDDEITPHWPHWEEALQTLSALGKETFQRENFIAEYGKRKSAKNQFSGAEALELLHRFSVIAYFARSGYGGGKWIFRYEVPKAGWDTGAETFKVHPGLKEFAKIREAR